jgi:hypothetical protein
VKRSKPYPGWIKELFFVFIMYVRF